MGKGRYNLVEVEGKMEYADPDALEKLALTLGIPKAVLEGTERHLLPEWEVLQFQEERVELMQQELGEKVVKPMLAKFSAKFGFRRLLYLGSKYKIYETLTPKFEFGYEARVGIKT